MDEAGNESQPGYPTTPQYPLAGCGSTPTPDTPQNLRASSNDPPDGGTTYPTGGCQIKLEWDPVTGADEYSIYRLVYLSGWYFYRTEVQAAVNNGQPEVYIERGDVSSDTCTSADTYCPYYDISQGSGSNCNTGDLEAFYVTAKKTGEGESPPSEIVFWNCDPLEPAYARSWRPEDLRPIEIATLTPLPESPLEDPTELQVCPVEDLMVAESSIALPSSVTTLETADLLTLGNPAPDPPWELLDLHTDHLGSVRLVTDESGVISAYHDFLPFGQEIPSPVVGHNTHQFTGHERDAGTGLDYMFARYYSPTMARFVGADPMGHGARHSLNPQKPNGYAYVLGNPIRLLDPDGAEESLGRSINRLSNRLKGLNLGITSGEMWDNIASTGFREPSIQGYSTISAASIISGRQSWAMGDTRNPTPGATTHVVGLQGTHEEIDVNHFIAQYAYKIDGGTPAGQNEARDVLVRNAHLLKDPGGSGEVTGLSNETMTLLFNGWNTYEPGGEQQRHEAAIAFREANPDKDVVDVKDADGKNTGEWKVIDKPKPKKGG